RLPGGAHAAASAGVAIVSAPPSGRQPPVCEARQLPPTPRQVGAVHLGGHHRFAFPRPRENPPPWIDDQGVAIVGEPVRTRAGLIGRDYVALVLDGPRAAEDLPVRGTRRKGEGRRDE